MVHGALELAAQLSSQLSSLYKTQKAVKVQKSMNPIHLFQKIAGDWDWQKSGVLVASQKVEYRNPVKLSDKLEVEVWVKSVGKKSLTIAYEAFIVDESIRHLSAESETVIVCFNPISNETVEVPKLWRESIEKFGLMTRS